MRPSIIHFLSLFTVLLAIINPLEAVPIFLRLLEGKDEAEHRRVARKSCVYALLLMIFFLLFGTVLLKVFGVSLSMVKIVGGMILTHIGFKLLSPLPKLVSAGDNGPETQESIAFVPLAMPIMFGPGGIATLIGMAANLHLTRPGLETYAASLLAIAATMVVTWLSLRYAEKILSRIGPKEIDAATRITGFFVSAMGMNLLLAGVVDFLQSYGIMTGSGVTR